MQLFLIKSAIYIHSKYNTLNNSIITFLINMSLCRLDIKIMSLSYYVVMSFRYNTFIYIEKIIV
jgi:hypothetical protein